MNRSEFVVIGIGLAGVAVFSPPAAAQAEHPGKAAYEAHCAVCHGPGGRGDGPLAKLTQKKVSDLSTIAQRSGGVFPAGDVEAMIDGRSAIEAHGPSDMPYWGQVFRDIAPGRLGRPGSEAEYRAYVVQRIKALVGYIGTLQR